MTSTSLSPAQDEYGFLRGHDFDHLQHQEFLGSYLTVLARRAARWEALLGKAGYPGLKHSAKLKRFVRKGVPGKHRKGVWLQVSGAAQLRTKEPDLYLDLVQRPLQSTVVRDQIRADLPRTFPDNCHFDSSRPDNMQAGLYNVLHAFALVNPGIGYCQGLNYVAGLLLLVTREEEATFWLLKVLLEQKLPDYYTPTMPGLLTDLRVVEALAKQELPVLALHIERLGVPWALFASKWFICLYSEVLPTETVLRVWDAVFYEGSKVLFRVALGLLKINQEQLLARNNFGDLVEGMKEMLVCRSTINCHTFLEEICSKTGPLPRTRIQELRVALGRQVEHEQGQREQRLRDREKK